MVQPLVNARPGERLAPGTVLAASYRLERVLGAGGFGVVWQARHVHLETECAVKLFDPLPGADAEDASARFLREARLTARLTCPYVAQVFDYGVHEQMPFLVSELLHGSTLKSHLAALRARQLRLSAAQTVRIVRNVAEALSVAHTAGVVHRDLKPENVFLVADGADFTAKVLDFGIAKWSTDTAPQLTATHTLMGTPHYMSPEQFESARQVDHRSDLWSLGVIAFECLTGRVPFPGGTFIDVAFKVCREGPLVASQLARVPAGFDAWFARATALGREHRFASALEQAQALESTCATAAGPAQPPTSQRLPVTANVATRRRALFGAAFVLSAGMLVAAAWGLRSDGDSAGQPAVAAANAAATAAKTAVESLEPNPAREQPEGTPGEAQIERAAQERVGEAREVKPKVSAERSRPALLEGLKSLPPAPARPRARAAAVTAGVGLEAMAIQRTVRRYAPAVRQNCWQRALNARPPGAPSSAKITALITVGASGRVQSVSATGAPPAYPSLAHCIESEVRTWAFPRSGSETVTQVPFMFVGQ